MSFLQSMAMGKAVIVTAVPSSVDYIKGINGVESVLPYDIKSMQDALVKLMKMSAAELTKLGEDNLEAIKEKFDEAIMANSIVEFLKNE